MTLDAPTAALFGALARARGGRRALHPRGRTYAATLELGDRAPAPLGPGRSADVLVRLSRSIGLPPPLPDVLGAAIRLPDHAGPGRHQDLLLSSTWGRHVLRPARTHDRGELSTILPFEHAGRRFVIGLLPRGGGRFALASAAPARRWGEPWGELRLGEPLPAQAGEPLRFDPFNTAPGLRLTGPFSELRRPAYAASQAARSEPRSTTSRH